MSDITFGVVVPFYNRSAHLRRLLASVSAQTMRPREVFIVDNGSTTQEVEAARQIVLAFTADLNVVFTASEKSGNANFARNAGTQLVRSSHVAYLDSDDWWEEDHLETARAGLGSDPQNTALYSSCVLHKETGKKYVENRPFKPRESAQAFLFSLGRGFAQSSGLIVPADIARQVAWSEQLRRNQDYDFFCRVAKVAKWKLKAGSTVNVDWCHDQGKPIDYASVLRFYEENLAGERADMQKIMFLLFSIKESAVRANGREYFPLLLEKLRPVCWPLFAIFKSLGYRGLRRLLRQGQ